MYKTIALLFSISLVLFVSSASADKDNPVVLFDQGHGQVFVIEDGGELHLRKLSMMFREAGFDVRSTYDSLSPLKLSITDVLVVAGPFKVMGDEEVLDIIRFVEYGGRLLVLVHISPTLKPLMDRLGVVSTNGSVLEADNLLNDNAKNYYVSKFATHPITEGVGRFATYGAWGLIPKSDSIEVLARTGPEAWIDHNRDGMFNKGETKGPVAVVVAGTRGNGRFVIFGDDAIFQNRNLKDENILLGRNLINWLK